nr:MULTISPECIES: ATP-binding cassette domain-containing protein [unclassified Actinomyces]
MPAQEVVRAAPRGGDPIPHEPGRRRQDPRAAGRYRDRERPGSRPRGAPSPGRTSVATTAITVRPANAPAGQPPLVFDREFTVGRRPGNGIVIENTTIVSGTHLRVRPTDQGWLIELVSQTNGMLVDGVDTRGPVLVTHPVRVQLANASGPVLVFVPQPAVAPASGAPAAGSASCPAEQTVPAGRTTVMRSTPPAVSASSAPAAPSSSSSAQTAGAQGPVDPRDPLAPVGQRRTIGGVRLTGPGTIGRYPDNALVIPDSAVSGRHARVERTPQGLVVIDNGSTNGIFVGGQRVPHVLVTQPTVIGMGGHFVEVSPDGVLKLQERGGELIGRDLTFTVNDGRLRLLDRVSFQLPGNELLAVVGPSGAGKSTLLKALTGEQRAQEGQVLFNGMDVYEHYETMRNMIGVVPQNDVVHANLTVAQTLQYAAELRFAKDVSKAERDQRIAEVLDDLDLTEHVAKRVKQLSGGQRKRVSTAIELLTKPGLLFLDEPTSGLDPQLDRDVMDLLARLAHGTRGSDSGRTVMVVTHNENHIDRADKVLILATGGRPVYYGPPRDVLPYFTERLGEIFRAGRLVTHAPAGGFADPTEITGYADVYALVRNHTPELRAALEARVPSTRPTGGAKVRSSTADLDQNRRPQQSWLRQVSTLVRRHLRLVVADPSYLAFMLILPLVMGVLTKVMEGEWGFAVPDYTPTPENPVPVYSTQALQLLVILITGAAFAGMAATIRELIGEREVFLREKAVGLRSGAYLLAKTVVLALIVTVQTLLMVGVALLLNDAPSDAVLLGSPGLELAVGCWLTAFTCGLLGLAVSAFVTSSEQVMPVLVVTIMAQLVLAGGVIPVAGRAVFEQLAWVMPARWGYALTASTVDMNAIVPYRADDLWEHSLAQWGMDAGALVGLGLAFAVITYLGLARRGRR